MRLVAGEGTLARDVQLAVFALAVGLLIDAVRLFATPRAALHPVVFFVLPLVAVCVGLGLRRVAPLAGLALGVVGLGVDVALGGSIATMLVFTQVLYEVCVHGPSWLWRWALRVSAVVTVVVTAVTVAVTRSWAGAGVGVLAALILVLPVLTAVPVLQYRDRAESERERAEQTARLADLDRRHAVAAERTRMARELHDVIANHLSAVAIHASALLSVRNLEPAAVDRAVRVIRENSVQGLAEMRRMVDLLRDASDDGAIAAGASLSDVDGLLAQAGAAGLAVRLRVTGPPRTLPVDVDLAAYRIVQESLTNALKHGDGAADVTLTYRPDRVTVTVTNPRPDHGGTAARPVVPGGGAGLTGMRERADLVGGRLTAGPDGPLWRVCADLPDAP
jgi:signal transduction histidine kinase